MTPWSKLMPAMFRTRNVSALDRVVRMVPALLTAYLWWMGAAGGAMLAALAVVSLLLLVTSLLGSCSIYYMLGWSTCPVKQS